MTPAEKPRKFRPCPQCRSLAVLQNLYALVKAGVSQYNRDLLWALKDAEKMLGLTSVRIDAVGRRLPEVQKKESRKVKW